MTSREAGADAALRLREAEAGATERLEELRRSEGHYRLLTERMVDVVWTLDPATWRFTYVSPSVERLRGYTPEEIMAEPVDAALTPEASEQLRAVVRGRTAAYESGESLTDAYYRNEVEQPCRDGSTVWTEVITRYLRNPETGRVEVVGVTRDITERRAAQEELKALHAELERRVHERTAALEEANRELEAFSYSVSHELRTPLRAIDGFSARIAAELGATLDEESRRLFAQVRWNAQRMGQLIDDLLAFSQAGRVDLKVVPVDMSRAARDAYAAVVADTPALWKVSLELGELPPVRGDAALLRRVWESLLSNAVKFSAARERPEIRVEGSLAGGEAVYCVRDNGTGFDMRYVGKLFGVFERLHGPTHLEGTGIGLALVRRIVTRHGGRVWAEGAPDGGAAFWFSLPAPS